VRIAGPNGERELALEKFFRIPASDTQRDDDVEPSDLATDIALPPAKNVRAANYEVRQKASFDWPLATASAVLQMSGSTVQSARIIMGAVATVPWLSEEAAQAIAGKTIDERTAATAGEAAVSQAPPFSHKKYKVTLASH